MRRVLNVKEGGKPMKEYQRSERGCFLLGNWEINLLLLYLLPDRVLLISKKSYLE